MRIGVARAIALMAVPCTAWTVPSQEMPDTINFNRHIRPILSDKCYTCHGPDGNSRKAGLRLDLPPATPGDGDASGTATNDAIVPGDPDASELIARILASDPNDQMPPPEEEKQLTDYQKALLRAWVAQGGEYEPHWAYIPPRVDESTLPKDVDHYENPIDAFINRRVEKEGLPVAGTADRTTLVRRLHWDLLGLPPTPAVARAFVESTDPEAYEALVDSLLSSPHYGERMAMDWLDAVRYADTNGYHSDEFRSIYPYRDYVIEAFNANMPFDQFTREQLAGDLLPNPTRSQLIASGYNRLNQITAEGGAQAKEYLAKYAADRVRTTGTVWLGTTMGCAECHDHKYDPISAKDFYSFAAFFADIEEKGVYRSGDDWGPYMYLPTPAQKLEEEGLAATIGTLESTLATYTPALRKARAAWEAGIEAQRGGDSSPWIYRSPASAIAQGAETTLNVQDDQRILARGPEQDKDVFAVSFPTDGARVRAVLLEALNDAELGGLSRGGGNFVLTDFDVAYLPASGETRPVAIASATADYEQDGFPIAHALDDKEKSGWAVDAHKERVNHAALFRFAEPLQTEAGGTIEIRLAFHSDYAAHQLDCFRIGFTDDDVAASHPWQTLPAPILAALDLPLDAAHASAEGTVAAPEAAAEPALAARTAEQEKALADYFLATTPHLAASRQQLAERQGDLLALRDRMATTLIAQVREEPREMRILPRGNFLDDSGPVVEPDTPEILPALGVEGRRPTRLDLAEWLVRNDNPLTARVTMNRVWDRFYGNGISKVLDDVGAQGEWPTHPDLLDWLAKEFVDSGWDLKHMVRLMVTSEAYKRSSNGTPEAVARDPFNRLFARQSRFRIEAELVRDGALAMSGLLTRELGGRSVYPYQPEGYYANCNTFGGELSYNTEADEHQYRRGLYTFWKRSFLHPSMLAFDAPTREECTAERTVSNTPLQALVLLNDPTYVEAARVFAQRIMTLGGEQSDARIATAFALALSREPSAEEAMLLRDLYHQHLMEYTNDPAAADVLVQTGIAPVPEGLNSVDLAAWTSVARVILNLHETITRS